ncbi:pet127 [Symbiodinium microadriaticum]|nr:pet127 [Symbiodinium microadriaticum]
MDVPLSYALWPVAVRLASIRKAVKGQKVARKQLQRNLQRAQQEGDPPDAGEVELQELEDIDDLEEMDEDVEDFVDLDDAELARSATSLEGQSFFQEGDLDQELRMAAQMLPEEGIFDQAGKSLSRAAVVEALLSQSSRSWTCDVERKPAILEDRPNPDGSFVAVLAHGLESVVELRGRLVPLSALPAKQRRALRRVVQPGEVNWKALPPFVPAHEDKRLERLALDSDCRYFSSTSSLTGLLSRCYFAISQHRQFDPCGLSKGYRSRPRSFSPSTRWPVVSYLRRASGSLWSLTAAKEDPEDKTVLLDLGKSMEYQLTMSKNDFDERFLKKAGGTSTEVSSTEQEKDNQAYRFLKVGRLMMRSQLDAIYQGLVFDVKTRAVSAVRHDAQNYEKRRKYRITRIFGARNSYELEIYEMMRNAFMKYGFQAKIGRMDGVVVAYHNTSEIFGFQYIPLADMERCIYGGREAADVAFDLSVKVLQTLLDFLTQDEDMAKYGTIKMRVSCEESANSDLGNALDVSAAAVLKEGEEAEVDELGTARHFRLLVNTFHGDGTRRRADEALQTGDYVEVTFTEVVVNAFLEKRGESGTTQAKEEWSPWQALQDLASAIQRGFQGVEWLRLSALAAMAQHCVALQLRKLTAYPLGACVSHEQLVGSTLLSSGVEKVWTGQFVLILLILPIHHASAPANLPNRAFKYRTYRQTHDFFRDLRRRHPNLVELWFAQDLFPEILPQKKSWGTCEGEACKTLIVRIANKQLLSDSTPEVFFSGALHGDERIGPATVCELANFLCEQHAANHAEVTRLVDGRSTWLMPMTNAHGYANYKREENGMDPNRDFPYLQMPQRCMQTQTARAVNELFRRHLFQFSITFHGGMRALTYEWGSKNHLVKMKSTESPDESAFRQVGESIREAAGKTSKNRWFYPLGPINDLVYPVDGGMEDWSYAAGFENSPRPITVCQPTTYGGYPQDRTRYRKDSISTLMYLAEMDDKKTAQEATLGRTSEIWAAAVSQGHVPRNLRMCLKLIELARPEVVVQSVRIPRDPGPGTAVAVEAFGFGCSQLTARLLVAPTAHIPQCNVGLDSGAALEDSTFRELLEAKQIATVNFRCQGLTLWGTPRASFRLEGKLPADVTGEVCLLIAAEFDSQWGHQVHPDPSVKPRSHAARLRLEERYEAKASDGPNLIRARRTKLFAAEPTPLLLKQYMQAAEVQPFSTTHSPSLEVPFATTHPPKEPASMSTSHAGHATTSYLRHAPPTALPEESGGLTIPLYAIATFSFVISLSCGFMVLANLHSQARQGKANVHDAISEAELAKMVGQSQPAE